MFGKAGDIMRVLWVGNPFFYAQLDAQGMQTHFLPLSPTEPVSWQMLTARAGFTPDVLVLGDMSTPPLLLGVEQFPCLTVFYAVDSHIHSWYPYYAQAFDFCLHSLRDHREKFIGMALPDEHVLWFPPYAKTEDRPRPDVVPRWDCLFVGTVNAATPQRQIFLQALNRLTPVEVTRGSYRELFPQARVVVNFCEHGDLNFRVFEALGCGCALVTPRIAHGQQELFTEGEHFRVFDAASPQDAAAGITALLADDAARRSVAAKGLAAVDAAHRDTHRAAKLAAVLRALDGESREKLVAARLAKADWIRRMYLRVLLLLWAEQREETQLRQGWLLAAQGRYGLSGPQG